MSADTALVLSGGGARGAYEAGVVQGLIEALGLGPDDPPPFRIFSGTSVGALNATYLAAHVDRGDLCAAGLAEMWSTQPDIRTLLQPDLRGMLGLIGAPGWFGRRHQSALWGPSLLDPRPLAAIVEQSIPWPQLRAHTRSGRLALLTVPTLHVGTGRVRVFAQVGRGHPPVQAYDDQSWVDERAISPDHLLASAAIPLAFPPRRLEGAYHVDGGVRLNTPITPALRGGARRLVVISLHPEGGAPSPSQENEGAYANPLYLAGRLLDALLVDGMESDLYVMSRVNLLLKDIEGSLDAKSVKRLHAAIAARRGGHSYTPMEVLVLRPPAERSATDEAVAFLESAEGRRRMGPARYGLLKALVQREIYEIGGLASYLLFDKGYTGRLVELGRETARRAKAEIQAFFG